MDVLSIYKFKSYFEMYELVVDCLNAMTPKIDSSVLYKFSDVEPL